MPTYDYRCTACKHEFELFQSMKDSPKRKCPSCGKNALERLIGIGAAVLFKGSGFYETDYRSKSYKEGAKKDTEAAPPKGDAKTESKPGSSSGSESKPKTDAGAKPASKGGSGEASPAKASPSKPEPKKAAG